MLRDSVRNLLGQAPMPFWIPGCLRGSAAVVIRQYLEGDQLVARASASAERGRVQWAPQPAFHIMRA